MSKFYAVLLVLTALFILPSASFAAEAKPLVVYFSWGGNCRQMAQQIQAATGGDLFEIATQEPYPEAYRATTDKAKEEQRRNARPALKQTKVANLNNYNRVILAAPNWWGSLPMPVHTFLDANDLSGKTVAQLVSHGGGGAQRCVTALKKAAPKAKFVEELVVYGVADPSTLQSWLKETGFAK